MLRHFSHCTWFKLKPNIFIFLSLSLLLIIYISFRSNTNFKQEKISTQLLLPRILVSNIRTHEFRRYPHSHSAIEYNHIQIDDVTKSMFYYNENETDITIDSKQELKYSENIFRSASFPIIWLDDKGDVHWNRIAQYEFLQYLLDQQFPNDNISTCLTRRLLILEQWTAGGFFSRHHTFIEHFGQSLYSPSMALLSFRRFTVSDAGGDDFRDEGILRYYQSLSLCASHLNDQKLKPLRDYVHNLERDTSKIKTITSVYQLFDRNERMTKYKYSRNAWKYGYDHVPHRRWLFDRNRKEIKKIINYDSPFELLLNHSNEHIYYNLNTSIDLNKWKPRNAPFQEPSDVLNGLFNIFLKEFLKYFSFR